MNLVSNYGLLLFKYRRANVCWELIRNLLYDCGMPASSNPIMELRFGINHFFIYMDNKKA